MSNDQYNRKEEQLERQRPQNYVTNEQNLLDVSLSRVITKRLSVALGVPFVNPSWALRDPAFPLPQERHERAPVIAPRARANS